MDNQEFNLDLENFDWTIKKKGYNIQVHLSQSFSTQMNDLWRKMLNKNNKIQLTEQFIVK